MTNQGDNDRDAATGRRVRAALDRGRELANAAKRRRHEALLELVRVEADADKARGYRVHGRAQRIATTLAAYASRSTIYRLHAEISRTVLCETRGVINSTRVRNGGRK